MVMRAQEMARHLVAELKPILGCDATAGARIATRHGVGRVRHLHILALGMQRHVQEGGVTLKKVDGDANVAELCAKHADGNRMMRLLGNMRIVKMIGRSELSLTASGETMA